MDLVEPIFLLIDYFKLQTTLVKLGVGRIMWNINAYLCDQSPVTALIQLNFIAFSPKSPNNHGGLLVVNIRQIYLVPASGRKFHFTWTTFFWTCCISYLFFFAKVTLLLYAVVNRINSHPCNDTHIVCAHINRPLFNVYMGEAWSFLFLCMHTLCFTCYCI